jgi:hypothetical protein
MIKVKFIIKLDDMRFDQFSRTYFLPNGVPLSEKDFHFRKDNSNGVSGLFLDYLDKEKISIK